jgi:hypothetical protein
MMKTMMTAFLGLSLFNLAQAAECKLKVTNLDSILEGRDSLRIDLVSILKKKGFELTRETKTSEDAYVIKLGTVSGNGRSVDAFLKAGDLLRTSSITTSKIQTGYDCANYTLCTRVTEHGKHISGSYILYKKSGEFTDPYDHVSISEYSYKYNDQSADTNLIKHMLKALPDCKKL